MIEKVVSGGQTGVDRAGLDAALEAGIPIGGYCPQGRWAEDGAIPEMYPLIEMSSPDPGVRTEKNVVESDGTLILNKGALTQGTKLTRDLAVRHKKPFLVVQLDAPEATGPGEAVRWLGENSLGILNIAGPRESKCPGGIYGEALAFLGRAFFLLKAEGRDPGSVEMPIEGTLDLHTFHPSEVASLVPEYLDLCREKGILEVRIIHGKGTGAMRETVHGILGRLPQVASFRLAVEEGGGWGATEVILKERRP